MAHIKETSVDTGWAWLVAIGIALWNLVIAGVVKSAGVLYVEFLLLYNDGPTAISWIAASFTLTLSLFGPLSGFIRDKSSHNTSRLTMAVATCIATTGIFATAWTQSAYQAIISFGVITGTAAAITNAPVLTCIGVYFKKRRFLANCIAFSGSSVGGFIVPIIMTESIAEFGVRGALMILAGIWFHVLISVAIMRPPDRLLKEQTIENVEENPSSGETLSTSETDRVLKIPDHEHQHIGELRNSCDNNKMPQDAPSSCQQFPSRSATQSKNSLSENKICQVLMDYRGFLCTPGLPLLCLTFVITSVAYYSQFFLLPPLIVENDLSKSFAAIIVAICSIVEFLARITAGCIVDKYPNKKTLLLSVSFSLTAAFGFTLSFMVSIPMLIIYSVVMGAFGGVFSPLMVPMLMKRVPEAYMGSAAGLYPFLTGCGSTIGPPIISLVKVKSGTYSFGLVFLSSCYILALLTLWLDWFLKKKRKLVIEK